MTVELVFFTGCPSVTGARQRLREALQVAGLPISWREWDTLDAGTPAAYRRYGSPTVLVDGCDVAGGDVSTGVAHCVVGGGPSVTAITAALGKRA